MMRWAVWGMAALVTVAIVGCGKQSDTAGDAKGATAREVVVYTALDREFSEPILKAFEAQTGIKARARYDTESTKTVGLVNAIRAEKNNPRCDVFWNNEIVNTIRLKQEGLLSAYPPQASEGFPETFRDKDGMWTGFAARARVLIVNTDLVKPGDEPDSVEDMADPRWKGRAAIAKPLFGTTASHAACLYAILGPEGMKSFFERLKANEVVVESSNKSVALAVSSGKLAFGLTDTDDAIIEVEAGKPVKLIYPDSLPDQAGTLFIPNTLALIKDSPNPEAGMALIEYLLSPAVEEALAAAASAQIPVNPSVTVETRVKTPRQVKAMPVDFNSAARDFAAAAAYIEQTFLQ